MTKLFDEKFNEEHTIEEDKWIQSHPLFLVLTIDTHRIHAIPIREASQDKNDADILKKLRYNFVTTKKTYLIKELNSLSQHERIGGAPVFCFPLAVFDGSNEYIAYTLHISSLCVGLKSIRIIQRDESIKFFTKFTRLERFVHHHYHKRIGQLDNHQFEFLPAMKVDRMIEAIVDLLWRFVSLLHHVRGIKNSLEL